MPTTLGFLTGYVVLWIFVIAQGALILGLLRRQNLLHSLLTQIDVPRNELLPTGSPAPRFSIAGRSSDPSPSLDLFRDGGGAIIFVSSQCGACKTLSAAVKAQTHPRIVVLCRDDAVAAALGDDVRFAVIDESTLAAYRIKAFPVATVIDKHLRIAGYIQSPSIEQLTAYLNSSGPHKDVPHSAGSRSPVAVE